MTSKPCTGSPLPGIVLPDWQGRSAGVSFSAMRKKRKNRQRGPPLWIPREEVTITGCGFPVGPGCGGVTWMVRKSCGCCLLLCSIGTSTARASLWRSSCSQLPVARLPAAATPLFQGKARTMEPPCPPILLPREPGLVAWAGTVKDPPGRRSLWRRSSLVPAGWIPQGGGRPLLWRFFGGFLIAEKATQRSVPTQAGGHLQTNRRRTGSLEKRTTKTPEPLAKLRGFYKRMEDRMKKKGYLLQVLCYARVFTKVCAELLQKY